MTPGTTKPSGRKLRLGRIVRYTHEASGIVNQPATITGEDDEWFYCTINGYSIKFPVHKDNRFDMVKDFCSAETVEPARN